MSGLALHRAPPTAGRWPLRPPAPRARVQGGMPRPALAIMRAETARPPPIVQSRRLSPLVLSLAGHGAVALVGIAITLLLPSAPPAPASGPPSFSVELAIAPTPAAAPEPTLEEAAPQPVPPPEAVVVPRAADMAEALPAPDAPPMPVAVPRAADMAAALPVPDAPPAPIAVPRPADRAAALDPPSAPPEPALAPPPLPMPPPVPPRPPQRQVAARHVAARPMLAKPALARTAAPAAPGPASAPALAVPADHAPLLIASPRFRVPPRPPVYPRRAVELRAQGEALIGALLDPSGTPHDVRVLRSSGYPMLDRAAVDAVGGWAFEPGRRGGRPVAARVEIPVRFTLR